MVLCAAHIQLCNALPPYLNVQEELLKPVQNKRLFYTALFSAGEPADTPGFFERFPGWDYILFTNTALDSSSTSWDVQHVRLPREVKTQRGIARYIYANRYFKWQIHKLYPEYEVVAYLDAAHSPVNLPQWQFVESKFTSGEAAMAVAKHPKRENVYQETVACMNGHKIEESKGRELLAYFENTSVPEDIGLWFCSIFIRQNRNPELNAVMDTLWLSMLELTYRDQLMFPLALWKSNFRSHIYEHVMFSPEFRGTMVELSGTAGLHQYTRAVLKREKPQAGGQELSSVNPATLDQMAPARRRRARGSLPARDLQ